MTLPSRTSRRARLARGATYGLATVLAVGTAAVLPTGPAVAAGVDPLPASAGAAWLRANLAGASVPDSLEAALGLQSAGDPTGAAQLRDATASRSATYTGRAATAEPDPTARTAWYVQQLGGDASSYGTSGDLLATLDGLVGTDGRLGTASGSTTAPTVAGQTFATAALVAGGTTHATEANAATAYASSLQCAAGFLNDALPVAGATVLCDPAKPSVRATALYVVGLRTVAGTETARARAVDWLAQAQQSNGRWVADGGAGSGDAAATALASWALALSGRPGPAGQGAVWLRGNQLLDAGACAPFPAGDAGAVAPDGGTYSSTAGRVEDFRLATARALLVLPTAPGGPGVTDNVLSVPPFARPGQTLTAKVRTAPRNLICASAPTLAPLRLVAGYDTTADFSFDAGPAGSTTASIVDASGQVDSATVTVLGKKRLAFSYRDKAVRKGKRAVVTVRGLAPGETAKVLFRGKQRNATVADATGRAKLRWTVRGRTGYVKVRVVGQYDNRHRTKFLIVRR